jgi:hypothetical protein
MGVVGDAQMPVKVEHAVGAEDKPWSWGGHA